MTINEIQDEIIEEFNDFDDWMDSGCSATLWTDACNFVQRVMH